MDRAALRGLFERGDTWFGSSPLYRVLARTVAGDDALLDLAAHARDDAAPSNLLFAAAHLLVLRDPSLPLAAYYRSVADDDVRDPGDAGPAFAAFCHDHAAELEALLRTRLVQTSAAGRGVSVRLGLHAVARRVDGPVTLLEVGPGAGLQLRFDRWAVETGGRRFGPDPAPVTLRPEWRGDAQPPDLDALPTIADRLGVDLHPVDVTDPEERLWLKALVWPEHTDRFAQLTAALDVVAQDPPEIVAGDAVELLPRLDAERLAPGVPVVVWHSMVRIHVPEGRRAAFDAAIAALAGRRRLLHLSLETPPEEQLEAAEHGHLLRLEDSAGEPVDLAYAEGHGRWVRPLA